MDVGLVCDGCRTFNAMGSRSCVRCGEVLSLDGGGVASAGASAGSGGVAGSLDILIAALDPAREKVPEVRLAAAIALGKSNDQRARAALAEAARRDPDSSVKAAAQHTASPPARR